MLITNKPNMFEIFDELFNDSFFNKSIQQTYRDNEADRKYVNGILHCETGPAVIYHDKSKKPEYWLNGIRVNESDINALIQKVEDAKQYQIVFEGKNYTLNSKQYRELKTKLQDILKLTSI